VKWQENRRRTASKSKTKGKDEPSQQIPRQSRAGKGRKMGSEVKIEDTISQGQTLKTLPGCALFIYCISN
jgi:hypothetical protein